MACMIQGGARRGQPQLLAAHFSCMRWVVEVSLVEALEALLEPKEADRTLSSSSAATGLVLGAQLFSMTSTKSSSVGVPSEHTVDSTRHNSTGQNAYEQRHLKISIKC